MDEVASHAVSERLDGHLVRKHTQLSEAIAKILRRLGHTALTEQRSPEHDYFDRDRSTQHAAYMDIVSTINGQKYNIDVSVTNALSDNEERLQARANADGKAARARGVEKIRRYGSTVIPFVLEAHGRLGSDATTFLNTIAPPEGRHEFFAEVYHTVQRITAAHIADAIHAATT